MFKIVSSKKGISPILATLLLIVIAVAAVIVTYAWVLTFTTTQTQQAGAVLSLENVRYYHSTGTTARNRTDIVIRNTGTADAKIVAVYWSSTGFSALQVLTSGTDYSMNPSTGSISAGSSITVTFIWGSGTTLDSTWSVSTTYYYKVVTEAGQFLEISKKSPAS